MMKKHSVFLLSLLAAVILGACASAPPAPQSVAPEAASSGALTRINVDQLAQMLADTKDFTLVNVHVPFEGDLPETDLSIPFDQIDQHLAELPGRDDKIVLYCRSGRMSDIAARRLVELGYTNVYDVTGGMVAWEAGGRSVVRP